MAASAGEAVALTELLEIPEGEVSDADGVAAAGGPLFGEPPVPINVTMRT